MREDIYLLIAFKILDDDFGALAALVRNAVNTTRNESGSLAYEFSASADRRTATMVEHFQSSAAFIDHAVHSFAQHAEAWNKALSLTSMTVIGNPSEEARRLLPADAVYMDHVDGFSR